MASLAGALSVAGLVVGAAARQRGERRYTSFVNISTFFLEFYLILLVVTIIRFSIVFWDL